jgi:hypothetical protein
MPIVIFWIVTLCSLVGGYHLNPEDVSDTSLRNVGNHLEYYTAPQPGKPQSTDIILNREALKTLFQNKGLFFIFIYLIIEVYNSINYMSYNVQ